MLVQKLTIVFRLFLALRVLAVFACKKTDGTGGCPFVEITGRGEFFTAESCRDHGLGSNRLRAAVRQELKPEAGLCRVSVGVAVAVTLLTEAIVFVIR